ncbi:MAG: PKD domain-containing protein [Opitutaceae bacterium]|jgi:murein DD-endopeptidase MepM/ murein hydrolase activator NlpD
MPQPALAGYWPALADLNPGETCEISTTAGPRRLTLIGVQEMTEPDYFIQNNPSHAVVVRADAEIEVDGVRATVTGRPFQLPIVVNGVRVAVQTTRGWSEAEVGSVKNMGKAVRLELLDASLSWGPPDLVFHIDDYRWRSSTYNNTWSALVPFNKLYYHRGEDFGAIPDRLPVVALFAGRIAVSPLADGRPSGSNHVLIVSPDGAAASYGHMNYDRIDPAIVVGAEVKAGQRLGLTGSTWGGKNQQHFDPHVHLGLEDATDGKRDRNNLRPSANLYPMIVDAYFRKYPDPLIAVAGGYRFASAGGVLELDATRSVARPGEEIASCQWLLHDGSRVDGPLATLTYPLPGLYSEELVVRTKSGAESRDFAQVRVYDPLRKTGELGFGWFYHTPVRGIRPGTPVLFWSRLETQNTAPVYIDFGDGTPPQIIREETTHAYSHAGRYTASLRSLGWADEPLTVKMNVVVEAAIP